MHVEHLKTIYINCESDGKRAELGQSYIVRFDRHSIHTVVTQVSKIGKMFCDVHLMQQDGLMRSTDIVNIVLLLTPACFWNIYGHKDSESSVDRIYWMINNFKLPNIGMRISVYTGEEMDINIDGTFSLFWLWPTKEQWDKNNTENYITFQKPEANPNKVSWNRINIKKCINTIETYASEKNLDIKYLDYTQKYEDVYRTLLKAKAHFSYTGSFYSLAPHIGIPTIGIGRPAKDHSILYRNPFADTMDLSERYMDIKNHLYGRTISDSGRVQHLFPDGKLYNYPVISMIDTNSPDHIKEIIDNLDRLSRFSIECPSTDSYLLNHPRDK